MLPARWISAAELIYKKFVIQTFGEATRLPRKSGSRHGDCVRTPTSLWVMNVYDIYRILIHTYTMLHHELVFGLRSF